MMEPSPAKSTSGTRWPRASDSGAIATQESRGCTATTNPSSAETPACRVCGSRSVHEENKRLRDEVRYLRIAVKSREEQYALLFRKLTAVESNHD